MAKRIIDGIEVEASSGNVFADLGLPNADKLKIKSGLVFEITRAARNVEDLRRIVRELNSRGVSVDFVKNRLIFGGSADPTVQLMLIVQEIAQPLGYGQNPLA